MKTITRLLCIVIMISIPMALLAAERDDYRSRDSYYDRPTDRGDARLFGVVKATDKHGRTMQIVIGGRTERIRLADGFHVYSGNRSIDIGYVRKGESVRIEGYRSGGNEFMGLTIYVNSRSDSRDDRRYEGSIQARVTRTASIFTRTLRVSALSGGFRDSFDLDVASNAEVIRNGRKISVHEIRAGDIIEAQGYWQGSDFIADVVQVNSGYASRPGYDRGRDYRTFQGVVQDGIDYRNMRFTLDNGPDKFKVYGENARVMRDGNTVEFRDIRRGQVVTISGYLDGRTIYADHIDVSRDYRTRDWRY